MLRDVYPVPYFMGGKAHQRKRYTILQTDYGEIELSPKWSKYYDLLLKAYIGCKDSDCFDAFTIIYKDSKDYKKKLAKLKAKCDA